MEVCCEYTDDKVMWVSADQRKIITRILELKKQYPDKVDIQRLPEQNDGCIYATCPAEWLRISPPRAVNMSDEQKAETAERLKKARVEKAETANRLKKAREEKAEREEREKAEQTKTEQAKAEQGECKAESEQENTDVPAIIANAFSSNPDAMQILFGAHNSIKCTP